MIYKQLLYFFPYWKIPCLRKLISQNFPNFVIRKSLSREVFLISLFTKIYP